MSCSYCCQLGIPSFHHLAEAIKENGQGIRWHGNGRDCAGWRVGGWQWTGRDGAGGRTVGWPGNSSNQGGWRGGTFLLLTKDPVCGVCQCLQGCRRIQGCQVAFDRLRKAVHKKNPCNFGPVCVLWQLGEESPEESAWVVFCCLVRQEPSECVLLLQPVDVLQPSGQVLEFGFLKLRQLHDDVLIDGDDRYGVFGGVLCDFAIGEMRLQLQQPSFYLSSAENRWQNLYRHISLLLIVLPQSISIPQ